MSAASHDNESISLPNKKGLSAQHMQTLSQGGEEAPQILFRIWEDLENSFHDILGPLTATAEFAIVREQGEVVKTGSHVDLLLMKVMDDLIKKAIHGEGRIDYPLVDGTEDQKAQLKYGYVKDRFLDYIKNLSFKNVENLVTDRHATIEGKEIQLDVSTWNLEKAEFPFDEDVILTRAHEQFVIEQFPRIKWSGGAKESEVLDSIAGWTGIERENLEERLISAHDQAELISEEKIKDLVAQYDEKETLLQREERIGKIMRLRSDSLLEPLKCTQLQDLFEHTLTEDAAYQNLRRYRELCNDRGLLSGFFSISKKVLFDFFEFEESEST